MTGGIDRRQHVRRDLVLKVEYQQPGDLLQDYITNLGAGGVFIATQLPLKLGEQIVFSLSFPGLLDPVEVAGVVRWHQAEAPDRQAGFGVEFVFEDEQARQRVDELMNWIRRETAQHSTIERPFNVLLVEDNEFVLEMFGYAVQRFHRDRNLEGILSLFQTDNCPEALEILARTSIDLLIVDHFLPGMTGTELIQRLRADTTHGKLPILMISVGGEEVKEGGLRAGASFYLHKPVMLKQLLSTIDALVRRSGRTPTQPGLNS